MCIVMPLRIGGFKPPFCLLALQSNMIIHVQYMCWVCFSADNECLLQAVLSVSQWRWYATIGLTWRCCVTPCHLVTLNACVRVTIVSQVLWEKSVYIGSRTPRILSTQVGKPTRSSSTQHIIEFQSLSYLLHCQHPGALGSSKGLDESNACVRVTIVSQVLWEKSVYIGSRTPRILSTQVGKPG